MRSCPSCWNKTLAQLGFKRKKRKASRQRDLMSRRSLFENLEQRQMLAADFTVTTAADTIDTDNVLSLREALIEAAVAPDPTTIDFAPGINNILLTGGQLTIDSNVDIIGPGSDLLTIDAGGSAAANPSRVFLIHDGNSSTRLDVSIGGLTITGGYTALGGVGAGILSLENITLDDVNLFDNHAGGSGGGIAVSQSKLVMRNSTVDNNSAGDKGGGIYGIFGGMTGDSFQIDSSTISNNTAAEWGGGLTYRNTGGFNDVSGSITNSTFSGNSANASGAIRINGTGSSTDTTAVTIVNSTITNNEAPGASGGLTAYGYSKVLLHNTILAGNRLPTGGASDLVGPLVAASSHNLFGFANPSGSYNITGPGNLFSQANPGLTPLGDYGGPTKTHALAQGSPAIDAGDSSEAAAIAADQRGYARILNAPDTTGSAVDIGAYERGLVVSTASDQNNSDYSYGNLSLREALTLSDGNGIHRIEFDPALTGQTISLTLGQLAINSNVDIIGPGSDLLTIDAAGTAANLTRVFLIHDGNSSTTLDVSMSGLSITGGYTTYGGGISNYENLTLDDVTLFKNHATYSGGGIITIGSVGATLVMRNSTVDSNTSGDKGGGIYGSFTDQAVESFQIDSSTISNNTSGSWGGGLIYRNTGNNDSNSAGYGGYDGVHGVITNSTFSGNTGGSTGGICPF